MNYFGKRYKVKAPIKLKTKEKNIFQKDGEYNIYCIVISDFNMMKMLGNFETFKKFIRTQSVVMGITYEPMVGHTINYTCRKSVHEDIISYGKLIKLLD